MACAISCGTLSLEHSLHPGLALDCRLGFSKRSHRGHEGPEKGRVNALLRTLLARSHGSLEQDRFSRRSIVAHIAGRDVGDALGLIVAETDYLVS